MILKKVEKELEKIEKKFRYKIYASFLVLQKDPYFGKKLDGEFEGYWTYRVWTYRVWPYRVIYKIRKSEVIVEISKIGHRQGVYK